MLLARADRNTRRFSASSSVRSSLTPTRARLFVHPHPAAMKRLSSFVLIVLSLTSATANAQRGGAPGGRGANPAPPPLKFQFLGPASGGRFASIAGVAGDLKTWYLGAASGG